MNLSFVIVQSRNFLNADPAVLPQKDATAGRYKGVYDV